MIGDLFQFFSSKYRWKAESGDCNRCIILVCDFKYWQCLLKKKKKIARSLQCYSVTRYIHCMEYKNNTTNSFTNDTRCKRITCRSSEIRPRYRRFGYFLHSIYTYQYGFMFNNMYVKFNFKIYPRTVNILSTLTYFTTTVTFNKL